MSNADNYAANTVARDRAYRDAFNTPEAKRWMESLTPEQRRHAEELGLLEPRLDSRPADTKVDDLPLSMQPSCELEYTDTAEDEVQMVRRALGVAPEGAHPTDELRQTQLNILKAYFARPCKNPDLRRRCIAFLLGQGSGAEHARQLGMSRQRFDYHARKMQKELGLPSLGNFKASASVLTPKRK